MEKKLYRSRSDKMFSGVCGGLGKYINLDPTVVRVLFAVLSLLSGGVPGLVLYVVLVVIIPEEPAEADGTAPPYQAPYQAQSYQPPQQPYQPPYTPPPAPPAAGNGDAPGSNEVE